MQAGGRGKRVDGLLDTSSSLLTRRVTGTTA